MLPSSGVSRCWGGTNYCTHLSLRRGQHFGKDDRGEPGAEKAPADFEAQCALTFANIGAALASQGADFSNLVEFTTYLVHSQDITKFMAYRTREFPKLFPNGAYPPNTLLVIDRLVQEQFLIEVSAVAAL